MSTVQKRFFESSEILRKAFYNLKKTDRLSLRKWSGLVGLHSSILNLILNSKRIVPRKHLKLLAESLNFDALATADLIEAHTRDWLVAKGIKAPRDRRAAQRSSTLEIEDVIEDDHILLKSWLHLALLESFACEDFSAQPNALARRFGVPEKNIVETLADLQRAGFLVIAKDGRWVKKNKKMRIATKRSRQLVRDFHTQMLKKALQHMQSQTESEAFENRLVTGYTVSANPKKIKKAKLILEKALIEACTALIDGKCTEVYQVQLQLFPLTKK